ncbi:hypothetical protein ElyMa_005607200 [Elysia marginata]|uniref:CARD domain-containing protein n=1 Tax=Elysia marginata TaxID=1093978 RepID=A0AAV4F6R6_9GAST|nr:hypothetical protein ElyMa_005607200 [Elysia marginata]
MIAGNLQKLGLTGCDIPECESNKDCEVVVDVHSRRLVALLPDDKVGMFKQLATAEWLKNQLSTMHREALYSRVIKTEEIKLKDIQQIIICLNDKAEELIDHVLDRDMIKPGGKLREFMVDKLKQKGMLQVVEKLDGDFGVAEMYILIKAIDEKLAKEFLPIVKAVTHQYRPEAETEAQGPTSSETSLTQYRQPPAYPSQHKTVSKKDEAQITQAPGRYGATSEVVAEAAPLEVTAFASSDVDGSALGKSMGAIPKQRKKRQSRPVRSTESVLKHITEISDRESFIRKLAEKCEMAQSDCESREDDLRDFIRYPTEENKEKALEATRRGFWRADFLELHLNTAGKVMGEDIAYNPFLQKHRQLVNDEAFKLGLSPLVGGAKDNPYFYRATDTENNTYFSLIEGLLPSEAIKACGEQLFIADYFVFFQSIVYELLLETLGEEIFDWYFRRNESRLMLTPVDVAAELHYSNQVVSKILVKTDAYSRKDKLGLIKAVRPSNYKSDGAFINRCNMLHAICTRPTDKRYTVPGMIGSQSMDELATYISTFISQGTIHVGRGQEMILQHESTYRCEWNKVMEIRTAFNNKKKEARTESQEHEPVQTERGRYQPR